MAAQPGVQIGAAEPRVVPPGVFDPRAPAPPAGSQDVTIELASIDRVANFGVYSIRNGRPVDIRPYLTRPSIPDWSKWVVVPGISSDQAFEHLDAILRAHVYHVSCHPPREWNAAKIRKTGLMLGAARAAMMVNYQIGGGELTAGEQVESPLAYQPAIAAAAGPPAVEAQVARWYVRLPTLAAAPPEGDDPDAEERARRAVLTGGLELTDNEQDAIAIIVRCGQCALPLQGYALVNDGHHYVSTGNKASFRACQTVEKQLWTGPTDSSFFSVEKDHVRDVIWHKAGHPVVVALKHELATDDAVRINLQAADLGSAASRLPAIEAAARAGSAYLSLCKVVSTIWEQYGAWIGYDYLEGLMAALSKCTIGVELPAGGVRVTRAKVGREKEPVTKTFNSRQEVLDEIADLTRRCSGNVAMAAGFYKAYLGAQDTDSRGQDSLLQAYSIKSLERNESALYLKGAEMHLDYRAFKADKRKKMEFDIASFAIV